MQIMCALQWCTLPANQFSILILLRNEKKCFQKFLNFATAANWFLSIFVGFSNQKSTIIIINRFLFHWIITRAFYLHFSAPSKLHDRFAGFFLATVNSSNISIEILICICFVRRVVNREYLIFLHSCFVLNLCARIYLFIYSFLFEWHLLARCEFHGIVYAELLTCYYVQLRLLLLSFYLISFHQQILAFHCHFCGAWKTNKKKKNDDRQAICW